MNKLFCFGTLCNPDVMEMVTGTVHTPLKASIRGYTAFYVQWATFPMLIESDEVCEGVVYTDLSDLEMEALDAFEGVKFGMYNRSEAEIDTNAGTMTANVYLSKTLNPTNRRWKNDSYRV